jgi:hypothetical protein
VISGRSSELVEVRADFFRFALMAVPHAEYTPCGSPGSPGKYDQAVIQPPDSNESLLAVVTTRIWPSEIRASKDFLCAKQVEPTLEQGLLSLGPIARDAHGLL